MKQHVAVVADTFAPASGAAVSTALRSAGYFVAEIDAGADLFVRLSAAKPDAVFNAMLTGFGVSGTLQGLLEYLQVPYTHSGVLASALAADRHRAKMMFKAANIPVTDHVVATRAEVGKAHAMPPPYVVKPLTGWSGRSALLVKAGAPEPLGEILAAEWEVGEELMVERHIPGRDLSCAVMGDVALGVTETVTDGDGERRLVVPQQMQPKIYEKVRKMALKAHAALGCRGVTQTDFRFNDRAGEDGELVCLKLTTQPAMTQESLVPHQARQAGHSFEELVAWMVEDASCNR